MTIPASQSRDDKRCRSTTSTEAAALLLSSNIVLNNDYFAESAAIELASSHGRVQCVNAAVGETQTGHGNVMLMSLHGGHRRAGGGAERGGLRALRFHHQINAIQAPREKVEALAAACARWPR